MREDQDFYERVSSRRSGGTAVDVDAASKIVQAVDRLLDGLYDVEVIRNPRSFAAVQNRTLDIIVSGTVKRVIVNEQNFPLSFYLSIEAPGTDQHIYLLADTDSGKTTLTQARWKEAGATPIIQGVLPGNASLYVDIVDPTGNTGVSRAIVIVSVPIRGRRGALRIE